ncbi:hypothetical protein [Carp edema virus]|nr:hypothetical protein [Carp edema virus]
MKFIILNLVLFTCIGLSELRYISYAKRVILNSRHRNEWVLSAYIHDNGKPTEYNVSNHKLNSSFNLINLYKTKFNSTITFDNNSIQTNPLPGCHSPPDVSEVKIVFNKNSNNKKENKFGLQVTRNILEVKIFELSYFRNINQSIYINDNDIISRDHSSEIRITSSKIPLLIISNNNLDIHKIVLNNNDIGILIIYNNSLDITNFVCNNNRIKNIYFGNNTLRRPMTFKNVSLIRETSFSEAVIKTRNFNVNWHNTRIISIWDFLNAGRIFTIVCMLICSILLVSILLINRCVE